MNLHLDRREFLQWTSSAALLSALAVKADGATDDVSGEWRNKRPAVSYRRLGRTNFMVSEIICGGNQVSPDNYKHVVEAFEMGLNYFDTAIAYGGGKSQLGYAKALKEVGRENVFLASKASPWLSHRNKQLTAIFDSLSESDQTKLRTQAADTLAERKALDDDYICRYFDGQQPALEASALSAAINKKYGHKIDRPKNYKQVMIDNVHETLTKLETDYLDVIMCPHAANAREDVTDYPEIFEAFAELKKAGKVRHLAASSHSDPAGVIDGAVSTGEYSVVMCAYNIVNQAYLQSALDQAKKADLGIIAMKVARPVHHGRNNGRPNDPRRVAMIQDWMPDQDLHLAQKCYLWALQDPRVTCCNSEMVNSEMVRMNVPLAAKKA